MSGPSKSTSSSKLVRPLLARLALAAAALGLLGLVLSAVNRPGLGSDRTGRIDPQPGGNAIDVGPAGTPGQIGEGVWLVGPDVQPGTFRSAGATGGGYCRWSRHDTASGGSVDGIIASDGSYDGQMVVTIEAGDVLFRTAGCAPFAPAG